MTSRMKEVIQGIREMNCMLLIFSVGGLILGLWHIELAIPSLVFCIMFAFLQAFNLRQVNARCSWVVITTEPTIGSYDPHRTIAQIPAGRILRVVEHRRNETLCLMQGRKVYIPNTSLIPYIDEMSTNDLLLL